MALSDATMPTSSSGLDDQDDEFFRVAGVLEVMKMSLRREDKIVCMEGSSSASS
jgi:hypothetical protein